MNTQNNMDDMDDIEKHKFFEKICIEALQPFNIDTVILNDDNNVAFPTPSQRNIKFAIIMLKDNELNYYTIYNSHQSSKLKVLLVKFKDNFYELFLSTCEKYDDDFNVKTYVEYSYSPFYN